LPRKNKKQKCKKMKTQKVTKLLFFFLFGSLIFLISDRILLQETKILYEDPTQSLSHSITNDSLYLSDSTIAKRHFLSGKYDYAIIAYQQIIWKNPERHARIAYAFEKMGESYARLAKFDAAVDRFFAALKLYTSLKDTLSRAWILNHIGYAYYARDRKENASLAMRYYSESRAVLQSLTVSPSNARSIDQLYASLFLNMACYYDDKKQHDEFLVSIHKAIALFEKIGDRASLAVCYNNLGGVYVNIRHYQDAELYLNKANVIYDSFDDLVGMSQVQRHFAKMFMYQGKSSASETAFVQALALAQQAEANVFVVDIYADQLALYKQVGDWKSACVLAEKIRILEQKIYRKQQTDKLAELSTSYEVDKKDNQIKLKDSELARQGAIRKQQSMWFWFIIGAVLLILAVVSLISLQRYRYNKKLEATNIKLQQLSIVAEQTSNVVAILDAKGIVTYLNSGFHQVYGYDAAEFIGRHICEVSNYDQIHHVFLACISSQAPVSYECKTKTKNGQNLWVKTTLTPVLVSDILINVIAIDTDVTAVTEAKMQIEKLHKNTTDSIHYARKIQDAVLFNIFKPSCISDSFVFFRPKDIVSGDFYWTHETADKVFFGVIDCTGHGVPGAFMSILAFTLLNQAVIEKGISKPNDILDYLHHQLYALFTKDSGDVRDSMELVVCCFEKKTMFLEFAGVKNSMYIVRDKETIELKGDVRPIGNYTLEEAFEGYRLQGFPLKKRDVLYLFSDGYKDQRGGPGFVKKKGFSSNRFKLLLEEMCHLPMQEQERRLEHAFLDWKGSVEQYDDILVIGVRM
jgi:PAS domain S-box-containing protein